MSRPKSLRLSAALLLPAATGVAAAGDGTDFLMNVFSDIGPILALFGEEFARQFLSESFTVYDHLIFACVPLGIMTAVAGAIRVQGPKFAQAFIGRARENRAAAEIQYMSSTSGEVCELFNGLSIVRTMGQPDIAQLLIFPNRFGKEKEYGIYTLQTALKSGIMTKKRYNENEKFEPRVPTEDDMEKGDSSSYIGGCSSSKHSTATGEEDLRFLNSPNLQLNIPSEGMSPNDRRYELKIATAIAITLQISLLVIAGIVSYHNANDGNEPWGLPCYVSGSVLLFCGMFACSAAIEQSTVEFEWKPEDKDEKPNIAWVQRLQRVSDQDFDPYIIYTNEMSHILTSSRLEDVNADKKNGGPAGPINSAPVQSIRNFRSWPRKMDSFSYSGKRHDARGRNIEVTGDSWQEGLTLFGALGGGFGFTVQFIGLRGLPWPCGVAHLGAIFIMALIRAAVRRRLGNKPRSHRAPVGFELDFLATRLVETNGKMVDDVSKKKVRWRRRPSPQPDTDKTSDKDAEMETIFPWKVQTATGSERFAFQDLSPAESSSQELVRVRKRLSELCQWKGSTDEPASALALSIERFMNEFVGRLPDNATIDWTFPCIRTIRKKASDTSKDKYVNDSVTIRIEWDSDKQPPNNQNGRWKISHKTVEATLSLWMAHLENDVVRRPHDGKINSQTLLKPGTTQKVDYCRIIGETGEKQALIRDVESWVKNPTVSEIGTEKESNGRKGGDTEHENIKIFIGFIEPLPHNPTAKLLVQHSSADLATIAAQHLFTHFMWTISKHIPRDVLHRGHVNVHEFVKVQSSGAFDPQSPFKLGSGQKLSHSKLTKFTTTCEKDGLGTMDEILLCMIPALSFKDLLPNDIILKSNLPKERLPEDPQRKKKLCNDYIQCLGSMAVKEDSEVQEHLTLSAVVDTMEFVYLMALDLRSTKTKQKLEGPKETDITGGAREPNEQLSNSDPEDAQLSNHESGDGVEDAIVTKDLEVTPEKTEGNGNSVDLEKSSLQELLEKLSKGFSSIVQRLSPFYDIQGRRHLFLEIFQLYTDQDDAKSLFPQWTFGQQDQTQMNFMDQIGFGKCHHEVCNVQDSPKVTLSQLLENNKQDIFGWTALHYAAARPGLIIDDDPPKECGHIPNGLIDIAVCLNKYHRSPIHIAASCGNKSFLGLVQKKIPNPPLNLKPYSGMLDGMTPIHLAMDGNHASCLEILLKIIPDTIMEIDAWNRNPVHVAALKQSNECLSQLSRLLNVNVRFKFKPESLDASQKTPLSYLYKSNETQRDFAIKLLLDCWEDFDAKDGQGHTVLHHSVRFLSKEELENLLRENNSTLRVNERNRSGETPLHLATSLKESDLVRVLLDYDADPFTKSALGKRGIPPIVLACQSSQVNIVKAMLKKRRITDETEKEIKRALPYAIKTQNGPDEDRKEMVEAIAKAMDNIDIKEKNGRTALHEAVIAGEDSLVSILLDKKANPRVKDNDGRNALHHAAGLSNTHDSIMIMERILRAMPDCINQQDNSKDTPLHLAVSKNQDENAIFLSKRADLDLGNERDKTPLMIACETGFCLKFIEHVVFSVNQEMLKTNINRVDSEYGQTALAWACERGVSGAVSHLLKATSLDLNCVAKSWNGYTPLHFVLYKSSNDILQLLLDDVRILPSWGIADADGKKPIDVAMDMLNIEQIMTILRHRNAGHTLFSNAQLKYLAAHNDSEIQKVDWDGWMKRLDTGTGFPMEVLVKAGKYEDVKLFLEENSFDNWLDADNWALSDLAESYGHGDLAEYLRNKESESQIGRPPYLEPSSFINVHEGAVTSSAPCDLHEACGRMILDAEIRGPQSSYVQFCYLRTKECIPMNVDYFYFEVEIIKSTQNNVVAIGFCDLNIPQERVPGWDVGSWAYHGDDGNLYVESGDWRVSGDNEKPFAEGDVVGCGLNFKTGKGYRTLNGSLLDSEDAFKNSDFSKGKLYPCIGFDTIAAPDSIHVSVTLKHSQEHPFRYQGPYDGSVAEHDESTAADVKRDNVAGGRRI